VAKLNLLKSPRFKKNCEKYIYSDVWYTESTKFFVTYAMTYFLHRVWNTKSFLFSLQYAIFRRGFVVEIPVVTWRTTEKLVEISQRETKSIWNVCSLVQTNYSVWYRDETEMGWYEVRYAPCLSKLLLRSWFAGHRQGRTRYLNLLICDHYRQDVYFWSSTKENVGSNMVGKSKWHCVTNFLSHNFSSCNIIFK